MRAEGVFGRPRAFLVFFLFLTLSQAQEREEESSVGCKGGALDGRGSRRPTEGTRGTALANLEVPGTLVVARLD